MATPRSLARWPSVATVLAVLAVSFGAVLLTAPRAAATTFVSGAITADTTWGASDNEYILVADVVVRPGVRLTILPGTTVKINPNHALFVEGELRADGQPGDEILFLQNNTISLIPPIGIQFNGSAQGSVTYSVIDRMERGVTAFDSSPSITDNVILRTNFGVALQNSFANVERNYINNTLWGVYVVTGGQPYIADNVIANASGPFAIGIYVSGGANADLWRNTVSRVQGRGGPNAGIPGASGADGGPGVGILVESAPWAVIQDNMISQVYGGPGGAGMENPGGTGGRGGDGGPGAGIVTGNVIDSYIDGNAIVAVYGGRGGNGGGAATTGVGGAGGRGGDAAGIETFSATGAAWWYSNWIDGATAGVGGNGADAILDGLGGAGGDAYGVFGVATTNPDASGNILQNLRGGLGGNSTNLGNGNNNGGPGGAASGIALTGFAGSATVHTNTVSAVTGGQGGRGSAGGRGGNATGAFTFGQAGSVLLPTFVTSNWVQSITGGEGALGARSGGDGGLGSAYVTALVTPFLGWNGAWTIAGGDGGDAIDGSGGGRGGDATGIAAYLVSDGWSAGDWVNTITKGAIGVGPPAQVSYATGFYLEGNATFTTTFTIDNATIGGIGGAADRDLWVNFNAVGTTINTAFQETKLMVDASSTLHVKNFLATEVYWPDGFTPVAGANILVTEDGATVWSFTSATGFDQWLLTLDRSYKGSTTATNVVNDVSVSYLSYGFSNNPRTVDMAAGNTQPFVMIDGDAPTSSADALPTYTASLSFDVNYTASDGGGVGLNDISLWFRRNAGAWTLFATQFAGNFGTFAFVAPGDGTYEFETTATDLAGNAEPGPSTNESWTIVDTTSPGSRVNALPTWQTTLSFPVSWAPDPGVTDIRSYTIQYNRGFGWNNWLVDTTQTSGNFLALFQSVYQFRAIATDWAGNVETASTNDTWTIVDTVHPVSFTTPLPVYETTLTFPVWWEPEADDVATFQIDIRDNGGAWTTWIASTPLRTGSYTGQDAHTYEFRAIATDFAGNVENQPGGNESWTIVDVTSPLSFVAPLPAWRTSLTFTVNWAPEAGVTDIATYRIDVNDNGTGWTTVVASTTTTSGSFTGQDGHTYAFRSVATDRAGNVEAPGGADATTTVDVSAPTSSSSRTGTLGTNNWYVTDVTVNLSATDATSGVAGITYSVDGSPTWTAYSAPIVVTGEGFHKVEFRASDAAGNQENVRSTSFYIDLAAPATTASLIGQLGDNGWHTSPIAVSLSATDTASGVASIAYRIDGGAWTTYSAPFSVSTDGSHTVEFQATDNAGLVEAVGSRTFRIDATDPLVLNTAPRGANTNTTPRIVIIFSEAMNRTTVELAFSMNPDVSGTFLWSADSTSVTFTPDQALEAGTPYFVSIALSAKDMAGNTLPQTVTFSFTTAAPLPGGTGFEVGGLWWLILVVAAILGSLFLLRGRFPITAKAAPAAAAKPEDQAVLDDVFLLYDDGILIKHETRRLKPDIDTDILSGMLTAVQSFVKDSFRSEEGHLDEMTFGAMHILIGRGKWLILAAMVQGDSTDSMRKQMQKAIEDMEAHHADVVEGWDGNMSLAKTLSPYIKKLIRGDYV